jgi:multidrug transporter EmrE-like cation transporter
MIAMLIFIENILAVSAQLCLRHGARRLASGSLAPSIVLEPLRNPYILSGLVLHGVSFFVYVFILSKLQLSVLYPIATGLSILLITVTSVLVFGEGLTGAQVTGILAIAGGIGLVFAG